MRWVAPVLLAVWFLAAASTPAHALGVLAAISTFFASSPFLAAIGKIVVSAVLSRLAANLAPKPKQPGIKTETTATGSQNPANFILGLYATNGVAVCPPMSHSNGSGLPNRMLTYVIELADIPGHALNAVIINGERCTLGSTAFGGYGFPVVGGTYDGQAWVKFYDGTQTVADPMLLFRYGSYPQRPWTSAMVGRGICYAIVTFRYNRKVYTSFPTVRFELLGIPLYDPRKDSTVGGSGAHRLNNPATWERTSNPIIMVYNIHLGIALPGGYVWGGGMPYTDIPLASVFAAANACDALVDDGQGGTEPRYRAGYEVFVSDEPAAVCEEILKACLGQAADVGGFWRFQAGDPELPVFTLSDDDILVSLTRERRPFPSIESTHNAIAASYPDPAVQWEPTEAPPVYNATWEAEDGGRRRTVNVDFSAVPYLAQVQRNMRAMIADDRRFLTHNVPVPPEATVLEPLDTLSWTSAAYGYAGKLFEIVSTQESLRTGVVQISLRERNPADTAIPGGYFIAVDQPSTVPVGAPVQEVPGFAVSGTTITGSAGEPRRPALLLEWDAAELDDIPGIEFEVRRATTVDVIAKGTTTDVVAERMVVSEGILPNTAYEVRMKLVSDQDAIWTAWTAVTSPTVGLTRPDIAEGAVSDTPFFFLATGPVYSALSVGLILLQGGMGPAQPPEFWDAAVAFEGFGNVTNNTGGIVVALDTRERNSVNNVFSNWVERFDFGPLIYSDDFGTSVWRNYPFNSFGISGRHADFQYRLRIKSIGTGGNPSAVYLRNLSISFASVRR